MNWKKLLVLPVSLSMLFTCCPVYAETATASDMRLSQTEGGVVTVKDDAGTSLSIINNMKLFNGNHILTDQNALAYFNLDDTKTGKLDNLSEAEVQKNGKQLDLTVDSGHLFFNVTKPLDSDEIMNIRTSSMVAGIRGTSGFVEIVSKTQAVLGILDGSVNITVTNPASGQSSVVTVNAGQKVTSTISSDGQNTSTDIVTPIVKEDIPGCVAVEVKKDAALQQKITQQTQLNVPDIVQSADQTFAAEHQQRTSISAGWKLDSTGWWYQNADGSYQKSGWFQDSDGKWYYFNDAGYMLSNTTTPDGYQLGSDGAYVQSSSYSSDLDGTWTYWGTFLDYSFSSTGKDEWTHAEKGSEVLTITSPSQDTIKLTLSGSDYNDGSYELTKRDNYYITPNNNADTLSVYAEKKDGYVLVQFGDESVMNVFQNK